jgi:hypothetical protein
MNAQLLLQLGSMPIAVLSVISAITWFHLRFVRSLSLHPRLRPSRPEIVFAVIIPCLLVGLALWLNRN